MIPTKPPPTFKDCDRYNDVFKIIINQLLITVRWSPQFIDFVSRCLVKTPEKRATAAQLLHSDYIGINGVFREFLLINDLMLVNAGPSSILAEMITEAADLR